ncbi:hypothetical protein [Chryseobacterium scophthalmum]|uniref:Uncharacterized protein n=1 Tax=Chryseobacterium scophthalmum TaxID=59733 RepID=A0A1N6HAD5_9FLAO|nr:hypothetical protein [Chryseobacterium scophthalmum]SIO16774.1 hypothetical protein SAMN05421769_2347 [Chryseobacterium scophthalmum]
MQELDKLTVSKYSVSGLRNSNIVILTAIMLEEMCFSKHFVKGMLSSDFLLVIFRKITNHLIVLKSENT